MKKRDILKIIFLISIILAIQTIIAETTTFFEDFESYNLGYSSTLEFWVPQYYSTVNISSEYENKFLLINGLTLYEGDRDLHITFNRMDIFPEDPSQIILQWDYFVEECNPTWKNNENITPQASNAYFFYYSPNDFISVEFKISANSSYCGSGDAQISAFKRISGITSTIINYTTFNFEMRKKYTPKIILDKNSSNYFLSIYLDDTLLVKSENIPLAEVKSGHILLEDAGTLTRFDNVYINYSIFEEQNTSLPQNTPDENTNSRNSRGSSDSNNNITKPLNFTMLNPSNNSIKNISSSNKTKETEFSKQQSITGNIIQENDKSPFYIPSIILIIVGIILILILFIMKYI